MVANDTSAAQPLNLEFEDTNPTLTVNDDISFSNGDGGELTGLSVVEASGVQGAQTFTIEGPTYDDGAVDGYSTEVSYALVAVDGDDAGMTTSDSAGGEYAVTLDVVDGNTINGVYTDGQGAKQIAFTVSLSGDQITLTSFVALEHSNAPQGEGEDNTLDLGSLISVAATVTTTDGDGDVVANDTSAAQPLNLEFEDTNPNAVDDTDTVGTNDKAAGNVITAADTTNIGADLSGPDAPITVVKVVGYNGSEDDKFDATTGELEVDGQYGTLTIKADGSYQYVVDPDKLPQPETIEVEDGQWLDDANLSLTAFKLGESFFDADGKYSDTGTGVVTTGGNVTAFGVDGASGQNTAAEDQVNYSGSLSEALAFNFGGPVASATVLVSNLYQTESGGEAARWHAFDAAGNRIATGIISNNADGSAYDSTTAVTWQDNNVGTFTVSGVGAFTTLVFETVPYSSNGNATNDNSDYFVTVTSYDALPEEGVEYRDVFTYTIEDSDGDQDEATLTIDGFKGNQEGELVNVAPVAADNGYTVASGGVKTGNIITDDDTGTGAASGRDWDQDTPVLNLSVYSVTFNGVETKLEGGQKTIRLGEGSLEINLDGSFEYTADEDATGSDSFTYKLVNVHGAVSTAQATVTFDLPEAEPGLWFIAQADNHDKQSTPDKTLVEEGRGDNEWTFNVHYKQVPGNYPVADGETVTITLDLWKPGSAPQATFGSDYNIDVTGMNGFVVVGTPRVANGQLVVTVEPSDQGASSKNLVGAVFEVTVTAKPDGAVDIGEMVGFDIAGAVHTTSAGSAPVGSGWETNDDVLIKIDNVQADPVLIVGKNVSDVGTGVSGTEDDHQVDPVAGNDGLIQGNTGNDVLVGDVGGKTLQPGQKANIAFVLDNSGSMSSNINFTDANGNTSSISRLAALKQAVKAALDDLYNSGANDLRVHIDTFATVANSSGTFTLTAGGVDSLAQLNAAKTFVDGIQIPGSDVNKYTNYEAGLVAANTWIESGGPIANADVNKVVFVSDGEPNRALQGASDTGGVIDVIADRAMEHVLGTRDSTTNNNNDDFISEVSRIETAGPGAAQAFSIEAVGIQVGSNALARLSQLEGVGGNAINADDANDLKTMLGTLGGGSSNVNAVGNDDINGGGGNDVIFGDSIHADNADGGWSAFKTAHPTWSDTQLREELAANHAAYGQRGSVGGNDTIDGGAGDDTMYGQMGADTFVFKLADVGTTDDPAQDVVADFSIAENDKLDLSDLLDANHSLTAIASADNKLVLQVNDETVTSGADVVQEITLSSIAANTQSEADSILNNLKTSGQIID